MKTLSILAVLTALSLVLGCKRETSSDQTSTSADSSRVATTPEPTPDVPATSPTSRDDLNNTNRIYRDTATTPAPADTTAARQPDNTGKNERDRAGETLTPGDQGTTEPDREITRQIRRAITADDTLSTIAKNIKIITVNGQVTLRGPVKSEQEKQAITTAAQNVTGVATLDNQLEIKTDTQ